MVVQRIMAKYIITPEGKRSIELLKIVDDKTKEILSAAEDDVLNEEEIRRLRISNQTLETLEGIGLIRRVD